MSHRSGGSPAYQRRDMAPEPGSEWAPSGLRWVPNPRTAWVQEETHLGETFHRFGYVSHFRYCSTGIALRNVYLKQWRIFKMWYPITKPNQSPSALCGSIRKDDWLSGGHSIKFAQLWHLPPPQRDEEDQGNESDGRDWLIDRLGRDDDFGTF